MFKLAIFFSLILVASAITSYLENDFEDVVEVKKTNQDKIWVVDFNDEFEVCPLRQPNKAELKIFKNYISPVIKRNQRINNDNKNSVDDKDDGMLKKTHGTSDRKNATAQEIKSELKGIINKFLHSTAVIDPKQSISSKKDKKSSFKLYFEGKSCALVLQSGRFRNVYFNDAEDRLLPRWFFEEHDNVVDDFEGDSVPIPQEVKTEFYKDLLYLVKTLYGYAI